MDEPIDRPKVARVECGTCTACCRWEAIQLRPEHGDDPARYAPNVVERGGKLWLTIKPNGECVYLGPDGCTIWGDHPAVCRVFDCALDFLMRTRTARRDMIRKGVASRAVFAAGRVRAHGLDREAYIRARVGEQR